jgi:hypothetical protein
LVVDELVVDELVGSRRIDMPSFITLWCINYKQIIKILSQLKNSEFNVSSLHQKWKVN